MIKVTIYVDYGIISVLLFPVIGKGANEDAMDRSKIMESTYKKKKSNPGWLGTLTLKMMMMMMMLSNKPSALS